MVFLKCDNVDCILYLYFVVLVTGSNLSKPVYPICQETSILKYDEPVCHQYLKGALKFDIYIYKLFLSEPLSRPHAKTQSIS